MTERLEEIKTRFNAMKELESFKKLAPTDLFFDDYDWLIQQAERVEELEDALLQCTDHGASILKQNRRYREVIEFYANRDNYKLEHFDPNLDDYMSTVDYDEGMKARKALEVGNDD